MTQLRIPWNRIRIENGKLVYMGTEEDFYADKGIELIGFTIDGDAHEAVKEV